MIKYLKDIFNKESEASSKRFFGAIGFICAIFFIAIWNRDLIEELLYVSASLIGLGVLDKIKK